MYHCRQLAVFGILDWQLHHHPCTLVVHPFPNIFLTSLGMCHPRLLHLCIWCNVMGRPSYCRSRTIILPVDGQLFWNFRMAIASTRMCPHRPKVSEYIIDVNECPKAYHTVDGQSFWNFGPMIVHASLLFSLSLMSIRLGWACGIPAHYTHAYKSMSWAISHRPLDMQSTNGRLFWNLGTTTTSLCMCHCESSKM